MVYMVSVPPLAMIDDIFTVTKCSADAIEANAVINMKVESKRLRLSKDKCKHMHVSKGVNNCQSDLKVHSEDMIKVTEGSYLGDIISADGTIDKMIENRRQKGVGLCSQISGMINNVSLGLFFFQIAFTFRDAMLVNGMLTNAEVWNQIKTKHVEVFESMDLMILKKIFNAHSMTAKEAFFLEAGLLPISSIIAKRRLMYLWNVLNRNENDLLKRFILAQKVRPTKNDWVELVQKDKADYKINLSDEEISKTKKSKYEKLVEEAVRKKTICDLNKVAENHSKSEHLMKANLKREQYLVDPRFSRGDAELLFKLRTRMVDVKNNFSKKYQGDLSCRTCNINVVIESQEHILKCDGLKEKVKVPDTILYSDLFKTVEKQLEALKAFKALLREREIKLNTG